MQKLIRGQLAVEFIIGKCLMNRCVNYLDHLRIKTIIALTFTGLSVMQLSLDAQSQTSDNSAAKQAIYECRRISSDIRLSGRADDPLWNQAQAVKLVNPISGKSCRYSTTVRLLYNDNYLYIAFECEDNYVWGTITGRDSSIFTEECVEAFICPSGKARQYYELDVSPRNAVFDAFILNGRSVSGTGGKGFRSWTKYTCDGMETHVNINGELGKPGAKSWTVEYAIPFSSIIGSDNLVPEPGEEWRINMYRIDSPVKGQLEYYAWSPTGANDFHRFWKFGILKFAGHK
jgi:hypothetical protein